MMTETQQTNCKFSAGGAIKVVPNAKHQVVVTKHMLGRIESVAIQERYTEPLKQ